jgi:hypothetical protein
MRQKTRELERYMTDTVDFQVYYAHILSLPLFQQYLQVVMPDDTFATQGDEVPLAVRIPTFEPRKYQLEMLEESLRRNIIIALDTGAGKTHIAVLRIKHEIERESRKVCAPLLHTMLPACQCRELSSHR